MWRGQRLTLAGLSRLLGWVGEGAAPTPPALKWLTRHAGRKRENAPDGQEVRERPATNIPMGRWDPGLDVGDTIAFLCSDEGDWINGQSISVNGRGIFRIAPIFPKSRDQNDSSGTMYVG